jgi:SNF2 family DNA or RNA helicase
MLLDWSPEFLIADEVHLAKSYNAVRAKNLASIADKARYKFLLTGTPLSNSPLEIFMPYRILDGGATFGKNYFTFRNTWFVDENASWSHVEKHFPKYVLNPRLEAEFTRLLYSKADRVTKEECLDLPPLVKTIREVELSDEQRKAYNELKKDFIAFITQEHKEPRAVVAQLAVTKALRLQQIVCGSVKADDGSEVIFDNIPRIKELESLLEEITPDAKVIVWSRFKADYKAIAKVCEKLKLKVCFITGEQTEKEKQESVDAFQKDPEYKVLVANQRSGGAGLTLTAASYMIYYSKDFSLTNDTQSESRNHRNGSQIHKAITRIDLIATDTIDELINEALQTKSDIAHRILTADFKQEITAK